MERKKIERMALDYFQSGFICAEAVSKTIIEVFSTDPTLRIPQMATGFGGGVGGTKCENCGALTGGVLALGGLYGRIEPKADKQRIYELAAEYRNRFLDRFGSTNCRDILDNFGAQENMLKCKRLTAEATGILYEIIMEEEGDQA